MSENKDCCNVEKKCCGGGHMKVLLVLLVVGAIGGLSYMSGKMSDFKIGSKEEEAVSTSAAPESEEKKEETDRLMAKVDGEEIKSSEAAQLIDVMPPQMRQMPKEQLLPMALEQVINNKVISKQATKTDLSNDAEVKKQLALAKEQIIRSAFVEREVAKKFKPEDVQKEYEQYVKNFPKVEEVKAAHILVADEKKAKDLIAQLDAGKDFATLAKENSTDGTAQNGGELGYFSKDDVVPEFAKAAFETENGKYSKKPVKTEFGYHVLKVEDKRVRPPAEFEQVKPYIEQELRRGILEKLVKEWRAQSKIEVYDEQGNVIAPPAEAAPAEGDAAKKPEEGSAEAPKSDAPTEEKKEEEKKAE